MLVSVFPLYWDEASILSAGGFVRIPRSSDARLFTNAQNRT